jgi:uncharacterized surface protein with fasciclin (FAS1) repeats
LYCGLNFYLQNTLLITDNFLESIAMNKDSRRYFLKTGVTMTVALAGSAALVACGGGSDNSDNIANPNNIVDLAKATPDLSILVEALVAAGLVGALSGPGPLTVFAPTNSAFAALLTELGVTKAALLADKPLLTAVLSYHVLGAKVNKSAIPLGKAIDPILTGTKDIFKIDVVGANVVITDGRNRKSNITKTDIEASNGIVHLIDKVILPANKDIVETALASNPEFTTLVAALKQAGLVDALKGAGPFTVFAPTNAAFDALRQELAGVGNAPITVAALLANLKLGDILKYHVLTSRVLKAEVPVGVAVATLAGTAETISISSGFIITDKKGRTSNITGTDILNTNGVIHVIDKVILPSAA